MMAVAPEALFRHGKLLVAGMKLRCEMGTAINCGVLAVVKVSQVAPLRVEHATLVAQFKEIWWDPLESTCRHASLSIL